MCTWVHGYCVPDTASDQDDPRVRNEPDAMISDTESINAMTIILIAAIAEVVAGYCIQHLFARTE